ncbi:MAG: ABC transporter ATP-binding protein [Chloroherpetonaceae bacterium]|nr:ABC transporter ATP-binding protein [Chthonomonadaceae bacterium]MDW8207123.1 ABC transporter ATP-binding protein [Chloroherpetonaceae bacterium]
MSATGTELQTTKPQLAHLEHLEKQYGEGEIAVHALQDINLELPQGEFVVFVGPSGSGKTTLLNIIGGLDRPTRGRVVVAGRDLTNLDEAGLTRYRRDVVGFIFQFFNLVPTLTARENVELVAELARDPLDPMQVLAAVGLKDRAEHFPATLSGGEQQRVALARALVKRPALILADEPTGSLDYETGIRVLQVMREVTRDMGRSIFLVTHNSEITRMADRVVHLRSGRIAEVYVNPHPLAPEELRW